MGTTSATQIRQSTDHANFYLLPMKATLQKHGNSFYLDLTPETPEEVLQLVRFGMNKTKVLKNLSVYVGEKLDTTSLSVVLGAKRSESNSL